MATPIYKLFTARPSEAWHQLSQEEQNSLMAKVDAILEQVGGKRVVLCDSSWSSEQWPFFGVEQFPDVAAVQKQVEALAKLNWFRYMEARTLLGTEMPG